MERESRIQDLRYDAPGLTIMSNHIPRSSKLHLRDLYAPCHIEISSPTLKQIRT